MKLDLLTNATVVDDAVRFVSGNSNNQKATKSLSQNYPPVDNKTAS